MSTIRPFEQMPPPRANDLRGEMNALAHKLSRSAHESTHRADAVARESQADADATRATFSPHSLDLLSARAAQTAEAAGDVVEAVGAGASYAIHLAGDVTDAVAQTAEQAAYAMVRGVEAGANLVVEAVRTAHAGTEQVLDAADSVVTATTREAAQTAETVVGYAALAGLASGMLIQTVA